MTQTGEILKLLNFSIFAPYLKIVIKCQSQFDDLVVLAGHWLLSWLEHHVKKPFIVHATGVSGTDASDTLGVQPNKICIVMLLIILFCAH